MNEGNKLLSHTMKEKKKNNLNTKSENSLIKKNTYSYTPTQTKKPILQKYLNDEEIDLFDDLNSDLLKNKISLTQKVSKISPHKNKQDSLSNNMPNFVKNYDNLIEIIKINSKEKYDYSQFETKDTDYPIVKPFSLPSNTSNLS